MKTEKLKVKNNNKDLLFEQVPPQNLDAEMSVLGSMLLEEAAIASSLELLEGKHFYKDAHKKIYQAILDLYNKSKSADLITLTEELKRKGQLEDVGGAAYLTMLTTAVPTAANLGNYAKIVREKAILRNLISHATEVIGDCYQGQESADDILDKAERLIFEVTSKKIEGGVSSLKEIIKDSIETIDKLYQRKAHVTGIPTGFYDLDVMTAGLQREDFIVVAGRPSMGKSAFIASVAEHAGLVCRIPVALFSLEMSRAQLVQRMLCSHAKVDAHKVRTGLLSKEDWPRLVNAAGKLSEAPIYIDDSPSISVLELKAKARRLKAQHNIELVMLDYMQLMKGPARAESRQQEISEISRSLKALARELKLPLIAVSQLSRAVESRVDRRPQLSDLRESGAIEQDADVVMLLLREEYYAPTEENRGKADLIIAKQRNGPVGDMKLAFIREYTRFESLSRRQPEG